MEEVASILRAALGSRGERVPIRTLSLEESYALAGGNLQLRGLLAMIGRRNPLTTEKARRVLGLSVRPAAETVVDCAMSLVANEGEGTSG